MEHPDDDIPMMDAPEPAANTNPSSSAQRFSIVDVLGGDVTCGANTEKKELAGQTPDPMHSNMYEKDEGKVLMRLQELYPHTDIQKLPRFWSKVDRWISPIAQNTNEANHIPDLELSSDFLRVTKRRGTKESKDAAAIRTNRPIPRTCIVYYFEITVVSKGQDGYMGVGLSEKTVSLNRLPGWDSTSYGYHGDDGNFFASSGKGVEYGPTFTTGDVIGCGLNFVTREIFFTKNGKHLGVANTFPILLNNELFPTVGMQTADEMVCYVHGEGWLFDPTNASQDSLWQIDANFGQKTFMFDIRSELEAAKIATINNLNTMELPSEKVLWMNSLVSNWMAHEGYSRSLDALNRATGGTKVETAPALVKSESQGSTLTSISKDSQSPTAAAEKVAETVMRSMIGLLGGDMIAGTRRSVVRSVQEALHEEMEQRRTIVRMVKKGLLSEATERIEQLYPNLLETNLQLALLLKTQQFIEMLREISKELPPLEQEQDTTLQQQQQPTPILPQQQFIHSSSPRPSSSRGGKRSASTVLDDEDALAGTSTSDSNNVNQHNPVKRRTSDEEYSVEYNNDRELCSPNQLQQQLHRNGNTTSIFCPHQQPEQKDEEFMEVSEESQDSQPSVLLVATANSAVANGQSNGCCTSASLLVGTPPTSTTIIDEPPVVAESLCADGFAIEMSEEKEEPDCGGFASSEEQSQFERYAVVLEFGRQISQFSLRLDTTDVGERNCAPNYAHNCTLLKQRMNEAFSLLCYRDPNQSDHAYLLEQNQRDLVAKALNAAILESHGKEGISPLDKYLRRAKYIHDQALVFSASAVFTDVNRL